MKAISFVEAKDIIGGALNPFAGLVKGAQLGYDTGASIMGMVGGVVGGMLGGAMGCLGALVGRYPYFNELEANHASYRFQKSTGHHRWLGSVCCCPSGRERRL